MIANLYTMKYLWIFIMLFGINVINSEICPDADLGKTYLLICKLYIYNWTCFNFSDFTVHFA